MALAIQNRQRTIAIQTPRVRHSVLRIMQFLRCADAELSVVFVSDRRMQALNRTYRQKNAPTNVLAFPQAPGAPDAPAVPLLGDVVVALPTAAREAQLLQQSLEERVIYLVLHGLLHLLGYDHEQSAAARRRMNALEAKVLRHVQG
jgi:rRNA maturation RNase YbeY